MVSSEEFLKEWADDIRKNSPVSVDADTLDKAANELREFRKLLKEAIPDLRFWQPSKDLHVRMAKALGDETLAAPPTPVKHLFTPNRRYPWFCTCGYPPHHEKHLQAGEA